MNEVPLTFNVPPSTRTVDTTGEKTLLIVITGTEKTSFNLY